MQGLMGNDGPPVVNVILVLRFKSFGKTQAFRVQDLLEEPGDRTHRDVPGDTFPKEKNYILPFSLAAPSEYFLSIIFFKPKNMLGGGISLEELKVVQRMGTNENTKRVIWLTDNRPDDKLCKL